MDQKTYDVGMKMRRQVAGNECVDKAMANVDDFNRDFQRIVTQYCWGEAWGDDTLPPRERSILNLGMIASLGRMEKLQLYSNVSDPDPAPHQIAISVPRPKARAFSYATMVTARSAAPVPLLFL